MNVKIRGSMHPLLEEEMFTMYVGVLTVVYTMYGNDGRLVAL